MQEWKTDFLYFQNVYDLKKLNWKIEALSFSHKQEMNLCILTGAINFLKKYSTLRLFFLLKYELSNIVKWIIALNFLKTDFKM